MSDAIPESFDDVATGVVKGEALRTARRKRDTDERIEHLEERVDELADSRYQDAKDNAGLRQIVGTLVGQLEHMPKAIERLEKAIDRLADHQDAETQRRAQYRQDIKLKLIGGAIALFSGGAGAAWLLHRLGLA